MSKHDPFAVMYPLAHSALTDNPIKPPPRTGGRVVPNWAPIAIPAKKVRLHLRAIQTGERRIPQVGEYYLPGDIGEAHLARKPLSRPWPIVRLVWVIETTVTTNQTLDHEDPKTSE